MQYANNALQFYAKSAFLCSPHIYYSDFSPLALTNPLFHIYMLHSRLKHQNPTKHPHPTRPKQMNPLFFGSFDEFSSWKKFSKPRFFVHKNQNILPFSRQLFNKIKRQKAIRNIRSIFRLVKTTKKIYFC